MKSSPRAVPFLRIYRPPIPPKHIIRGFTAAKREQEKQRQPKGA